MFSGWRAWPTACLSPCPDQEEGVGGEPGVWNTNVLCGGGGRKEEEKLQIARCEDEREERRARGLRLQHTQTLYVENEPGPGDTRLIV